MIDMFTLLLLKANIFDIYIMLDKYNRVSIKIIIHSAYMLYFIFKTIYIIC